MSPNQQWISTMSMNRFSDHCYLIECAYHIISRYCCSFTNLLNHDDGSIPYYLVQKVKIAVECGKMLLNSRYRPFQQHLRVLGTYDYIDQWQYESLCSRWNVIKTETQIVEMYFNQISLLIYPVVSSSTLLSLDSAEYSNVPALTKINALIQSLMGCDETAACSSLLKSNIAPVRFNEEELSLFIVNNIIEPLFAEEDENDGNLSKIEYTTKQAEDLISYEDESSAGDDDDNTKDTFESCSMDVVDFVYHAGGNVNQLHFLRSSIFINDLYNLIGDDIFRIDDKLLNELLIANPYESPAQTKTIFSSRPTTRKQNDQSKRYNRNDANFRVRHDYYKRPTFQRKYQKRNSSFERTYPFDSAPKLWTKDSPNMQLSARI